MLKTNKSILKRFRLTRQGKLVRRRTGQNHFNAKASRRVQFRQKRTEVVAKPYAKILKRYLPYT